MVHSFAVNWDYRCPFARNAHEHVVSALRAGASWDVEFVPYSLSQAHVAEGDPPAWDNSSKVQDLLAVEAGIVVRDTAPDIFLDVHMAIFQARHDQGRDLRKESELRAVLTEAGADADAVMAAIADGWPRETFRKAHEASEAEHDVWGVPTFMVAGQAAFVRLMTRPVGDGAASQVLIQRVIDAVGEWTEVNELKHTSLNR